MARAGTPQEWLARPERGMVWTIRMFVWVALRLGRTTARLLLNPICAYFLVFSAQPRAASQAYLRRVLGRRPGLGEVFRHFHAFAACALDRVYLLNDQMQLFDLRISGEEIVVEIVERGSGCLLLGAHLGSFEVLRALGRRQPDLRVTLAMYEANARKINSVLNAINPDLAMDVVGLGRSEAMIELEQRLNRGHFVGMLADRSLRDEGQARRPFLGAPAPFPTGPFRMAALMQRPVVLMFGLYRGGRRYDIHFERLFDPAAAPAGRPPTSGEMLDLYVERLQDYCRMAPFNWFNFYDFWQ